MIELLFIKLSLYSYILFVIEMKKNIYRIIVMTGKLSEYKYQLHCHYSSRYISEDIRRRIIMIELLFIKLSLYSYILFVIEMKKNIYRIIVMTGKLSEYKYQLHCHYSSRYISLVIPRIRIVSVPPAYPYKQQNMHL